MNDYKELIEELKAHCGCIIYDDDCDKCDGLEPEKALCSLTMQLIKRCADAIEQLVKERDAAVADIKKNWMCATCSKRIVGKEWLYCLHLLSVDAEDGSRTCLNYKWRGVQDD